MKADSLQNIWKQVDSGIKQKSGNELDTILEKKIRKTMNKFYLSLAVSIVVSIGFLVFLIVAAVNKPDDILYRVNNSLLVVIVLYSLGSSLWSWYRLQVNRNNLPMKEWLEVRIGWLSRWLHNKLGYFLLPVLFLLTFFSLHYYSPYLSFTQNAVEGTETQIGVIIGIVVGGVVAFFVFRSKRRYYLRKLDYLKDLYDELCKNGACG